MGPNLDSLPKKVTPKLGSYREKDEPQDGPGKSTGAWVEATAGAKAPR